VNVNFTGIKNIEYNRQVVKSTGCNSRTLTFELTNDKNGNDFDMYKAALKKVEGGDIFMHPDKKNFVKLVYDCANGHELRTFKLNNFNINPNLHDTEYAAEIKNSYVPVFQFLNNTIKKIIGMEKFVIDDKILLRTGDKEEFFELYQGCQYLKTNAEEAEVGIYHYIRNTKKIKKGAKVFVNGITREMFEHFMK
jgi:hypothetical protein